MSQRTWWIGEEKRINKQKIKEPVQYSLNAGACGNLPAGESRSKFPQVNQLRIPSSYLLGRPRSLKRKERVLFRCPHRHELAPQRREG